MGAEPTRKRRPKGTESDADQGGGILGSDINQLSALFSANITVKADPEPKEDPGARDGVATSGMLDIRALAEAYESEFARMSQKDADEEPPMVSQTGLGLLMPEPEAEKAPPKVPYLLFAVIGLLLVAGTAAATAFIVTRNVASGNATPPPQQTAQAPAANAPGALPEATDPASTQAVAPAAVAAVGEESTPEATPAVATAESRESKEEAKEEAVEETEEEREARRARREERRLAREAAEAEAAEKAVTEEKSEPVVEETEPAPSAEPEKKEDEPASEGKCDEVACLVDPNGPCCAKKKKTETAEKSETESLPERLSASDVNAGLRPIKGRIDSCGDRHGFSGTAKLKLTIAGSGKVSSVSVDKGSDEFKSCVVGHVKKAKFEKTQKGMSLTYPIVFR